MDNKPEITATPAYEPGVYKWYDSVEGTYSRSDSENGTSAADSMEDTNVYFEIPAGSSAIVKVSLTVDDWGLLVVTNNQGVEVLKVSLTREDGEPGERGGHEEWSGADSALLPAGKYIMNVHHENVTYPDKYDPKYNISSCSFSLTATKKVRPTTIYAEGKVHVKNGGGYLEMNRPVQLIASVEGDGDNTQITNLRIGDYDASPVVAQLSDGRVAQIILQEVSAIFISDTEIHAAENLATRKARLSWTARILDPIDSVGGPDREVSNSTGKEAGNPDPTFSVSLD